MVSRPRIRSQVSILAWGVATYFQGCDTVPPVTPKVVPQIASCQECHPSPPPTGMHDLHLYAQTKRSQITCDECHATAIRRMLWIPEVRRNRDRILLGFHTMSLEDSGHLNLVLPRTYLREFDLCAAEVRGDTLFTAVFDSVVRPGKAIGKQDSLFETPTRFLVFPFLGSGDEGASRYGDPVAYDRCDYWLHHNSLFGRRTGPLTVPQVILDYRNRLTHSEEERSLFIYYSNPRYIDTLFFTFVPPAETILGRLEEEKWGALLTELSDGRRVLLREEEGWLYQIHGDSLFRLQLDSSIAFGDTFAEVTALHGDGRVDIGFLHEPYTVYQSDTLTENVNPITGETESLRIRSIGAWRPESRSCWNNGIPNGGCHNGMDGETYWYKEQRRE